MKSIILPSTLQRIECNAFHNINIEDVSIDREVTSFECEVPLFIKEIFQRKGIECPNCYVDQEDTRRGLLNPSKEIFEILNEIQTKGDEGNMNIFTLTEVIIPEGVTSIGDECFSWCSS